MSKHTPGPWKYHAQGDANEYVLLTNEKRWVIAFRQNGELLTPEQEANARLVAAAPDLLAALEELMQFAEPILKNHGFGYMGKFEKARKAINKARGAK